jgi:hypothetical protein
VNWKGGDQPVTGSWTFVKDGSELGAGSFFLKSGHAAIVFLPFGQMAISVVNSGGMNSPAQSLLLKNAWVDALYQGNTALFPVP